MHGALGGDAWGIDMYVVLDEVCLYHQIWDRFTIGDHIILWINLHK